MSINWNAKIRFKNFSLFNKRLIEIAIILDIIVLIWLFLDNFTDIVPKGDYVFVSALLLLIINAVLIYVLCTELFLQAKKHS